MKKKQLSFYKFVKVFWSILEPDTVFQDGWHIRFLCDELQNLKPATRALYNVPPRSMKSLLFTVLYPCYVWTYAPYTKFIMTSYNAKLSSMHSNLRRNILTSSKYKYHFPRVKLCKGTSSTIMNTSTGFMEATSLGGGITGYGSAIILIDDVENPVEMYSKAYNAEVKNYLDHVLPSRLNDHATGSIIAVQQRLHADDASAHLIKKGWKHVSIPAIATDDATYGTYERKAGEVLWSRTSEDILAQLKSDMGIVAFEAQYQQNPSSPDAQLIDWDKMVFGEIPNAFVAGRRKIISIDTTFTKSINSDYTGIIVMEALDTAGGRKYYIHKVINTKISYGELKELVHVLYKEYQPHTVLVELAANGHVLLEELRKLGIPVEGITPRTSKIARFNAVYEKLYDCIFSVPCNGNILLDQLKAFPYSKHDDMVDALVHGLTYFRTLRLKP